MGTCTTSLHVTMVGMGHVRCVFTLPVCVGRAVSFARWAAIRRDMLCIPKANHKKLVDDCYPTSKALVNAAPEYRPNANELGRLVYYAQCKPAKLSKVGRLLMTVSYTHLTLPTSDLV